VPSRSGRQVPGMIAAEKSPNAMKMSFPGMSLLPAWEL
jgi:hypothetical protein